LFAVSLIRPLLVSISIRRTGTQIHKKRSEPPAATVALLELRSLRPTRDNIADSLA